MRGRRTVRRPRLMEPTNLQIAIVERDMVWVCFDDFADCGEGRRGEAVVSWCFGALGLLGWSEYDWPITVE